MILESDEHIHYPRWYLGLALCCLGFVWVTAQRMPATVASHFDAAGAVNGFMPRNIYELLMFGILVVVSFTLVVVPNHLFNASGARINLPNREYWLAPERRAATIAILASQVTRFASMVLLFLCYVHWLVVRANDVTPPHLSSPGIKIGLTVFLFGTLIWVVSLVWRFRRTPPIV